MCVACIIDQEGPPGRRRIFEMTNLYDQTDIVQ